MGNLLTTSSSIALLLLIYGLWCLLCLAFIGLCQNIGGSVGLLARKVGEASEFDYLDGCAPLFDVVHLEGEE